jgi:phosphate transport system permease protein
MSRKREDFYKKVFEILAFASLAFLIGIVIVLFKEGLPIFQKVKLADFIFGKFWYPTFSPAEFGVLPLILASILVSIGAMLVCVPLGVGSALYLNELAGDRKSVV